MTRKIIRAILPVAPPQYEQAYVDQLRRTLDLFIDEQRSATINFQGVPSSGSANTLDLGDIFADDGVLKIVRVGDVFSGSTVGTTAVGTVTVVTP